MQIFDYFKWLLFEQMTLWQRTIAIGLVFFGLFVILGLASMAFGLGITAAMFISAYVSLFGAYVFILFAELFNGFLSNYNKFKQQREKEAARIVERLRGR